MEGRGLMMLRLLVNRFHGGSAEPFAKLLSKQEIQEILQQEVHSDDVAEIFSLPDEMIRHIHYSWLMPEISKLPRSLQLATISALPEVQFSGLCNLLKQKPERLNISEPIKTFLLRTLYLQLKGSEHLPLKFLPASVMNSLLNLSKVELVELIDFLGLHDLSEEIRFIVDKNFLKKLFHCLTPKMKKYLTICLHQRDRLKVPKLPLDQWDGNCKKLNDMLHRRGLARLGKALSGQNPELLWHITHMLDIGRGSILEKHYGKEEIPAITQALSQQVLNLVNFLSQKDET